jgi:hypothetical protein
LLPLSLSKTERITCVAGGIYPDRAAKQQTPVMQVIISQFLRCVLLAASRCDSQFAKSIKTGKNAKKIFRFGGMLSE